MSWKNWGDHPLVVIVGVIAGLSGVAGLAYTIGANSGAGSSPQTEDISSDTNNSASQDSTINDVDGDRNSITSGSNNTTNSDSNNDNSISVSSEGDNSPSISNSDGDVNINYNTEEQKIPEFTGEIRSGEIAKEFRNFTQDNDNKIVYIDAYIVGHRAEDRRERVYVCHKDAVNSTCDESDFTVLHDCSDPDPGGVSPPCYGMTYTIKMAEDSTNIFGWTTGGYTIKG